MRRAFRESLGRIIVYRVALLNQSELEEIKRNGFIPALNRRGGGVETELTPRDIVEYEILNLRMRIVRHTIPILMELMKKSGLISVSNNPRMATYAACRYLGTEEIKRKIAEGYKIYLFSIFSIPHLERDTGEAVWIGATTDHPNPKLSSHAPPFLQRQSVFVDSMYAYDREFIINEIRKFAIDSDKVAKEEIEALLESVKYSSYNL